MMRQPSKRGNRNLGRLTRSGLRAARRSAPKFPLKRETSGNFSHPSTLIMENLLAKSMCCSRHLWSLNPEFLRDNREYFALKREITEISPLATIALSISLTSHSLWRYCGSHQRSAPAATYLLAVACCTTLSPLVELGPRRAAAAVADRWICRHSALASRGAQVSGIGKAAAFSLTLRLRFARCKRRFSTPLAVPEASMHDRRYAGPDARRFCLTRSTPRRSGWLRSRFCAALLSLL